MKGYYGFQERYEKHETAIQKRWQPFSIEVLEQNVLEGTSEIISILEKAKQSAKEIHDQEEKFTYLEFIEDKLLWNQAILDQNRSTKAQGPVQSNETLNTDKSTQEAQNTWKAVEKINWRGTETQLVLLMDLLTQEAYLKYDRKWKMVAEHFLVQGKPTKSKNLSQSLENTLAGKTKDLKTLKEIISKVKKLED